MDKVLVVDFGSQYTQLIARRTRELKVYSEVKPFYAVKDFNGYKAVILSGGPASIGAGDAPRIDASLLDGSVPVFGICYGEQLICSLLGGSVVSTGDREFGKTMIEVQNGSSPIIKDVWGDKGSRGLVWMSHSDHIERIPEGFEVVASSSGAPFAMIANESLRIYGAQFHPEVAHTERGDKILSNFLFSIAGCRADWDMRLLADSMVQDIKQKVGDRKVIAALSGGVDSSVASLMAHKAIGGNLKCIFVDSGLLRAGEADEIEKDLSVLGLNLHRVRPEEHGDLFVKSLAGVTDPEAKRKIIGKCFIDIFRGYAAGSDMLLQGTLYPDVIESVSIVGDKKVTIKSHHNVGGLPEDMNMDLLEPLRSFFKDEVRALGRQLGLPEKILKKHPFPGPGLSVRLLGEVTHERLDMLRAADKIFVDAMRDAGLYDEIWQAGAILLPPLSVGVMGDERSYGSVCALRAVCSVDGMTAHPYYFTPAFLDDVASNIVNAVKGVNRVVYDCSSKPPATIEWE